MIFTLTWWTGLLLMCSVLAWVHAFTCGVPAPARYSRVSSVDFKTYIWTALCLQMIFSSGNKIVWSNSGGRLSHLSGVVRKSKYKWDIALKNPPCWFFFVFGVFLDRSLFVYWFLGQPGSSGDTQRLCPDLGRCCWQETIFHGRTHSKSWWEHLLRRKPWRQIMLKT